MIDTCEPGRSRKPWYRKKSSRRKAKNWLTHPGKMSRKALPIWAPFSKKRGRVKSWQKPFVLFSIFVDLLARIWIWLSNLLKKRYKPDEPIPVPKPGSSPGGSPGGKGRSSGPCKVNTCADHCGCLACDETCRPWFCAGYCAEDAESYNQICRCPGQAIDLDEDDE